MARPRYRIAEEDVPAVHRWVQAKCRDTAWPQPSAAHDAREQFPGAQPTAEQLQLWCDRFLDAPQWAQLQAVIRAARRETGRTRTVRLSVNAYARLHALAVREQLTLSKTIERHLADLAVPPALASPG